MKKKRNIIMMNDKNKIFMEMLTENPHHVKLNIKSIIEN